MKKLILFLLCMVLSLGSVQIVKADKEDTKEGGNQERFLKADGKVLRNNYGTGDIVTLRGTNVGGWQVIEAWMCPSNGKDQLTTIQTFTDRFGDEAAEELLKVYEDHWWQESDFDNIADLNFNVLRLPISYFNLLDENGLLREDTLATYDWFVEECEKRNIYVILDLHAAPGSQNGKDHSGDTSGSKLYSDRKYQEMTISLWEQLAAHYKGNPTIAGYDFLNEPEGTDAEKSPWGGVQLPFYDELYKAVRAIDEDHLIIFESIWDATDMPNPDKYGWENVMYQYHFYGWDGIDDATKQKRFIDSKKVFEEKTKYDIPVLIGEFTLFSNLSSWKYGLSVFEEMGWSWTTWTYKTVEYGNWGIYTSRKSDTPEVNIYTDSKDTIIEKWSKIDTKTSFKRNRHLADLLAAMADREKDKNSPKVWFHNFTKEIEVYGDTGASATLTEGSEVTSALGDEKVLKFEIPENSKVPQGLKYIQLLPMTGRTVDTTGMDYLLIDTFVRNKVDTFKISVVDKDGNQWNTETLRNVPPLSHKWETLVVDMNGADIDRSAIAAIYIGVSKAGGYYFKDIYFGTSYGSDRPEEGLEETGEGQEISIPLLPEIQEIIEEVVAPKKSGEGKIILIVGIGIGIVVIACVGIVAARKFLKKK